MADDKEIFDKAEADMRLLQSRLQLTSPELLTIFLLIVAKDLTVPLPGAFDGLTTNYAAILNPDGGGLNDEKLAISTYLGRVGTDLATFQYVLLTKIAQARAIANIQPAIPVALPAAPYIPPPPKRPNPVVSSGGSSTTTTTQSGSTTTTTTTTSAFNRIFVFTGGSAGVLQGGATNNTGCTVNAAQSANTQFRFTELANRVGTPANMTIYVNNVAFLSFNYPNDYEGKPYQLVGTDGTVYQQRNITAGRVDYP